MKETKLFFQTILIVVVSLLFPVVVSAATVDWSTGEYKAYAWISEPEISQTVTGSSPPLSASAEFLWVLRANSSISDTEMTTYGESIADAVAVAEACFLGTYLSPVDNPIFQFIYSLDYNSSAYYEGIGLGYPNTYAWIEVKDTTSGITIYSDNDLSLSSNLSKININTTPGHIISVNFGARTYSEDPINTLHGSQSLNLAYSTAVAPEPISSTLFIIGGTLLVGRRIRKRVRS